ncbi:spoIIIJ-associated protein [Oribacterium sp. KHPX15]|uniref:RNA-binding cell elongation regulator Jag/EloR n=1 Tax=unclassified Oribacterium TaxID=2629782 RepID=UPI0005D1AFB3|nr:MULTISPECIES: RNA-binding cell elongation regulator Jag/EloR [unclassified Oribacterium]SEA82261.1 spoIIIJ-associated protein [Oribacterium sp. KHPX15]
MNNSIRVSAKTKDEAITKALIQLGITSDRLNYNVVVEGKAGLFGIGAKPWIIEASVKETNEQNDLANIEKDIDKIRSNSSVSEKNDLNTKKETVVSDKIEETKTESSEFNKKEKSYKSDKDKKSRRHDKRDFSNMSVDSESSVETKKQHEIKPISEEEANAAIKDAESFIVSVLNGMNMDVNPKSHFNHEINELLINLEGSDMGVLIGKRGQTLDSLQYLTSLVVNKNHKEDYIRIKLDTEDYRSRREATLRNLAKNIAYKVRRNHKAVSLEPMNPYERRIIHSALQNDRFVTTKSEGEEPFRHVIIYMKKRDRKNYSRDNSYYKKESRRENSNGNVGNDNTENS